MCSLRMKIGRKKEKNPCKRCCGNSNSNKNNYTINNSKLAENYTILSDLYRPELAYVVPQVDSRSPRIHFTVFPEV